MGITGSKSEDKEVEKTPKKDNDPITPNSKLKIIQLDKELDPRSPSENVARTPIQLFTSEADKTNKHAAKEVDIPDYTPAKVILASDPRSPTTEYRRTPVVVGILKKSPIMKIHNKNLDKALKGYNTMSSQKQTPKKPNVIPPKLLETTPVRIVKADAYKRRSCVGLLETNVDYTETDLDQVILQKYHSPSLKKSSSEPKMYNRIKYLLENENVDPRSPTTDFIQTPLQVVKKLNEVTISVDDCASSEDGNEVKSVDIDSKPADIHNVEIQDENLVVKNVVIQKETLDGAMPDIVISSRSLCTAENKPKATTPTPTKVFGETQKELKINDHLPSNIYKNGDLENVPSKKSIETIPMKIEKSNLTLENKIDLAADLRNFDEKLTNLIYEDDDPLVSLPPTKNKDTNRTPLGVRNMNNEPKKPSRLKVSDKPRHSTDKGNSKIPVPQHKINKKYTAQCENTPPRHMYGYNSKKPDNVRSKKPQWDNDKTLII